MCWIFIRNRYVRFRSSHVCRLRLLRLMCAPDVHLLCTSRYCTTKENDGLAQRLWRWLWMLSGRAQESLPGPGGMVAGAAYSRQRVIGKFWGIIFFFRNDLVFIRIMGAFCRDHGCIIRDYIYNDICCFCQVSFVRKYYFQWLQCHLEELFV